MTGAVTFHIAGREDAADVLRLLREVPVGGGWRLGFEREPDPFADRLPPVRHAFVLARDRASGQAIGLCERAVRWGWLDGERRLLPYIGALRIAPSHRHRLSVLKGGFAMLRDGVARGDEHPHALTSIAPDNAPALRLLTAGVRGLPRYDPVGDYATLMLRPRGRALPDGVSRARPEDAPELDAFLAARLSARAFAPCWGAADIGWPLLLLRRAGAIAGCAGIWDQRGFRQVVVRGAPRGLAGLRPLANCIAPLLRLPALPRLGAVIPQGFLSPFLLADDADRAGFSALLRGALATARALGLGVLTMGLAWDHPWRAWVKHAVPYRTRLFLAHWGPDRLGLSAGTLPMPEVSLL